MKRITQQVDQTTEKHLSDGNIAYSNGACGNAAEITEQPDLPRVSPLPAKALPAGLVVQTLEDFQDSSMNVSSDMSFDVSEATAAPQEASTQAPEEQSEENLLVVLPRSAERRAEDFIRDWMRRFTRS